MVESESNGLERRGTIIMSGTVTIINYNANAHDIVSAAGRLSTTAGSADELYQRACDNDSEKNINLINKILSSGHQSVLEHIYVNLSFDNVSVFVEQFMIEFRLASFTVKSRRYVDFGKMGYVSPDFSSVNETTKAEALYQQHMEYLFGEYNAFIEAGIPKEDARFVLPYSFRSNFYCTVNARELVKIMNEMVGGRGKAYPEIVALGESLLSQCETCLPYLKKVKPEPDVGEMMRTHFPVREKNRKTENGEPLVTLLNGTPEPEKIICRAAALNYGIHGWENTEITDPGKQKAILADLLKGGRKRELEQVNFTIFFHRMSLAGVTHLVRHRMQSIIVPEYISTCRYDSYVLPESIVNAGLKERYQEVFIRTEETAALLEAMGLSAQDRVYLLLSGMTIPVMTTMNANELCTFFRLRTCVRAQWEIKECADELLRILREEYPVLFSLYGPSCFMLGKCPEGKMICGRIKEILEKYSFDGEKEM